VLIKHHIGLILMIGLSARSCNNEAIKQRHHIKPEGNKMKKVIAIAVTATVAITAVAIGINALKAKGAKKTEQTVTIQLNQNSVEETVLANQAVIEKNSGLTGADYGERTEEEMMRDEMNAGYTGADYGERTEEEMMRDEMNAGYTGADYGENA
jgi:hypothetical protein